MLLRELARRNLFVVPLEEQGVVVSLPLPLLRVAALRAQEQQARARPRIARPGERVVRRRGVLR